MELYTDILSYNFTIKVQQVSLQTRFIFEIFWLMVLLNMRTLVDKLDHCSQVLIHLRFLVDFS